MTASVVSSAGLNKLLRVIQIRVDFAIASETLKVFLVSNVTASSYYSSAFVSFRRVVRSFATNVTVARRYFEVRSSFLRN